MIVSRTFPGPEDAQHPPKPKLRDTKREMKGKKTRI